VQTVGSPMSTCRVVAYLALLVAYTAAQAASDTGPGLGQALSEEEAAAISLTITPDGGGLPEGSGSARAGESIYRARCLACHGSVGTQGINDRLAGGHGTLTSARLVKTVGSYWPYATTVFDYVRRAMPYDSPGSLSDDETYAVTAYVLFLNDIVGRDAILNASTLPGVTMPNAGNFVWAVPVR
jgi:hypothetical protein